MPLRHTTELKLPAVSGSSGRLVISPGETSETEAHGPGRVFGDERLDYTEAMHAFVAASQQQSEPSNPNESGEPSEKTSGQAVKRALRQEVAALRESRRQTRQRRKQEDAAWRALRHEQRAQRTGRVRDRQPKAVWLHP